MLKLNELKMDYKPFNQKDEISTRINNNNARDIKKIINFIKKN